MSKNYSFGLPLKHNFTEYMYYQGLFLPHEVAKILSLWDDQKTIKASLSGKTEYIDELRKSSVMFLENDSEND